MNFDVKHYAYIGDCVWELFVRKKVIKLTTKTEIMHKLTTKYVCAEFQAQLIEKISPKLTQDELEIQKRARNIKMTVKKRSNPSLHALATSFEAICGYLYLNNKQRLKEILEPIIE